MHFASLLDSPLWYAWLIPFFPLFGFFVNGVFGPLTGKPLPKVVAGAIGTVAVFASFAVACLLFMHVMGAPDGQKQATVYLAPWMNIPTDAQGIHFFNVNYELLIDPLSVLMMLIITGVGGLIHLYSTAYMSEDKGYQRFFTYLNLFVFFMLLLVMSNNILGLFIGWEGVGLCSYLLIGFFYEKKSAGDAAKKAFIVNRIGDVGVLIGMFFVFHYFGTLDFVTGHSAVTGITQAAPMLAQAASGTVIATLLLMFFLGCTGKSAQIPLYTWLPDAMEGPTPVSALIHAATMVTAGIYLVSRTHALFELSDLAMITMAVIGISTAFFAATIGLMQNDIKRVLAYSTVSQLGYMFAACGSGVFAAGMFHVMTHAFFKACLFLGSGSVIHAVEHAMHAQHEKEGQTNAAHAEHGDSADEKTGGTAGPDPTDPQDMRNMGGLFGKIPVTAWSMLLATFAICGVFPFAGFWSKDEILWTNFQAGGLLFWAVGAFTALLTAFYMMRMIMKTYAGPPRTEAAAHAHESSLAMIVPIGILAVLSSITGWAVLRFKTFEDFLAPSVSTPGYRGPAVNPGLEPYFGYGLLAVILIVLLACVGIYRTSFRTDHSGEMMTPKQRADHRGWTLRHPLPTLGWYNWAILNKYFVDEAYNFWFVKLGKKLADWLWLTFEVRGIDGIVNGVGALTAWSGQRIRKTQNGFVRSYAFSMVIGIVVILVFVVVHAAGFVH